MQGDNKISWYEPRSHLGVYRGHSPYHVQNIALILNLSTGLVSPQYHVVYDDDFTTVDSLKLRTVPTYWPDLYQNNSELVTVVPFQLPSEWNQTLQMQNSINWLSHTLESEVTNLTTPFDTEGESLPSPLSSKGVSNTSKGECSTSEGEFTNLSLDPVSGEITSSNYHFTVNTESSL